jgi:hypothetical protein
MSPAAIRYWGTKPRCARRSPSPDAVAFRAAAPTDLVESLFVEGTRSRLTTGFRGDDHMVNEGARSSAVLWPDRASSGFRFRGRGQAAVGFQDAVGDLTIDHAEIACAARMNRHRPEGSAHRLSDQVGMLHDGDLGP